MPSLTDLFTQAWAAVGVSFTSIDCFLADIDETGSVEELAHLMDIHEVRHPAGLSDAATDPFFETLITPESLSCLTSAEQEAVSRVRVG